MQYFIDLLDKFLSPKFVLILFAVTASVGFLTGKFGENFFNGALMVVFSFYYGSKQGEAAANLVHAQVKAANDALTNKIIIEEDK